MCRPGFEFEGWGRSPPAGPKGAPEPTSPNGFRKPGPLQVRSRERPVPPRLPARARATGGVPGRFPSYQSRSAGSGTSGSLFPAGRFKALRAGGGVLFRRKGRPASMMDASVVGPFSSGPRSPTPCGLPFKLPERDPASGTLIAPRFSSKFPCSPAKWLLSIFWLRHRRTGCFRKR